MPTRNSFSSFWLGGRNQEKYAPDIGLLLAYFEQAWTACRVWHVHVSTARCMARGRTARRRPVCTSCPTRKESLACTRGNNSHSIGSFLFCRAASLRQLHTVNTPSSGLQYAQRQCYSLCHQGGHVCCEAADANCNTSPALTKGLGRCLVITTCLQLKVRVGG